MTKPLSNEERRRAPRVLLPKPHPDCERCRQQAARAAAAVKKANMDRLSPLQMAAWGRLADARRFERRKGGYWTYPTCPEKDGVPVWYALATTMNSLWRRGLIADGWSNSGIALPTGNKPR